MPKSAEYCRNNLLSMEQQALDALMENVGRPMYKIEKDLGMPMNTLQRAMKGNRLLPKKWAIKLKHYVETKQYLKDDKKTTSVTNLNKGTQNVKNLTEKPETTNYTIGTTESKDKMPDPKKDRAGWAKWMREH